MKREAHAHEEERGEDGQNQYKVDLSPVIDKELEVYSPYQLGRETSVLISRQRREAKEQRLLLSMSVQTRERGDDDYVQNT